MNKGLMGKLNSFISEGSFRENSNLVIGFLLFLTIIIRVVFLLHSDNGFNGDSATRLYFCYQWYHAPSIMVGYDWLPLHFYMLGIPMYVFKETVWTPRIVTLIIAVLSVFPFLSLIRKIFGEGIALGSLLIFALLPAHIVLSVVSLSEVPFIFFLLYALNSAFSFIKNRGNKDLMWTVIFLSAINFIRFEGWLFTVLILLVFLQARVQLRWIWRYTAAVSIIIVYVLITSWLGTGDAFWGLNESDRFVLDSLKGFSPIANAKEIPDAFLALWIIFFPLGVLYTVKDKTVRQYFFIFSIPFLYALYKVFTLSLTGQSRYFITSSVLSIPFVVVGINQTATFFLKKYDRSRIFIVTLVCILLCTAKYQKLLIEPIQPGSIGKFYPGFISSALWINEHGKNAKVIIDVDNFSNYAWLVYADKIAMNNRTWERSYAITVSPYTWEDSMAIVTDFYQVIKDDHVTHIALFKNGKISARLNFHNQIESLRDLRFRKVYEYNDYRIYELI